jgi:hypothetical protein
MRIYDKVMQLQNDVADKRRLLADFIREEQELAGQYGFSARELLRGREESADWVNMRLAGFEQYLNDS